jgi:hypothetical protein
VPSPRCSRPYLRLPGGAGVRSRTLRVCRVTGSLSCLRSTSACLSLLATATYTGRCRMTPTSHTPFAAFVGLDWADAKHAGCLQATGAATRECCQLEHPPAAIDAWVTTLRTRLHGHPVASCLALHKGPLVFALRTYDLLVLFPIHPLTWARYREALPPRRAKAAPSDAALQLERLLTPRAQLQPRNPQSPTLRALAPLVAPRRQRGRR